MEGSDTHELQDSSFLWEAGKGMGLGRVTRTAPVMLSFLKQVRGVHMFVIQFLILFIGLK